MGRTDPHEYRDCIITFFDILGFRSLLLSRPPKEIAESLSVFRKASGHNPFSTLRDHPPAATSETTRVEIVSDAIVRITPNAVDPVTNMSELFNELIVLKEIQIECLQRGLLLRGATTIGPMYVDPDPAGPVFGPGLVEAFEMESREVIYPRIAVHSDIVERHKNNADAALAASYDVDLDMVSLLLTKDGAGLNYIDYIRVIFHDQNWTSDEVFAFLGFHRDLIHQGLRVPFGSIRRKYTWLRDYHNKSIDEALASISINSIEAPASGLEDAPHPQLTIHKSPGTSPAARLSSELRPGKPAQPGSHRLHLHLREMAFVSGSPLD